MSGFLLIKNPQASDTPRDECAYVGLGPLRLTATCAVPPCFFTFKCEATHSIQLQSAVHLLRIADLTPPIGSLLPLAGYSSSSPLEDIHHLYQPSIADSVKRCKCNFRSNRDMIH